MPSAKPGTKGRWPKGKANRVPRVKVLNYLKKVALFFLFIFISFLSLQSYVYYLVRTRKRRKNHKRGCCMIFEAKILIIRWINENMRRKKWLRGTGRGHGKKLN